MRNPSSMDASVTDDDPVRETVLPGRGVGLVAARDIAAGESVVVESALLAGVSESFRQSCCACCLQHASDISLQPCVGCDRVLLCDQKNVTGNTWNALTRPACWWMPGGHGPVACAAERVAADPALKLTNADRERLRFLAACAELRMRSLPPGRTQVHGYRAQPACESDAASRLDAVRSLCPTFAAGAGVGEGDAEAARRLHPMLERAVLSALDACRGVGTPGALEVAACAGYSAAAKAAGYDGDFCDEDPPPASAADVSAVAGTVEDNAELLAKEGCNAFGVMAPTTKGKPPSEEERRVRGGAVYRLASRVNHGCFPNVARFDNFDGDLNGDFPPSPAAGARRDDHRPYSHSFYFIFGD